MTADRRAPEVTVLPATPDRWPDLEVVSGTRGDPSWCFCQLFLTEGRGYEESADRNRQALCAQLSEQLSGVSVAVGVPAQLGQGAA